MINNLMTLFIVLTFITIGFVIGGLVARNNKKQADIAAQKLKEIADAAADAAEKAAAQAKEFAERKAAEITEAKPAKRGRKPKNPSIS